MQQERPDRFLRQYLNSEMLMVLCPRDVAEWESSIEDSGSVDYRRGKYFPIDPAANLRDCDVLSQSDGARLLAQMML